LPPQTHNLDIALLTLGILFLWGYGGYAPVFSFFKRKRKDAVLPSALPFVSFIIPAYNEADYLADKLKNTLGLKYPQNRLEIIVAADGTDDHSEEVVLQFSDVIYFNSGERLGKCAAMNNAAKRAKGDILIYTDANAMLSDNAISEAVRLLNDAEVGMLSGEKSVLKVHETDDASAGEGFYWKYESYLKKTDDAFETLLGAVGEFFAIKKELYIDIPHTILLDDYYLSMQVLKQGYRIAYAQHIIASENGSANFIEEAKRKIRISAGGWQSIFLFGFMLNPFDNFRRFAVYFSHRLLRWMLLPWITIVLPFIFRYILVHNSYGSLGVLISTTGLLVYIFAFIGLLWQNEKGRKVPFIFNIPFYVLFMNVCAVLGFFRYAKGIKTGAWTKVKRA